MKAIKIIILALILSVTACKKTNTIEPKVDRIVRVPEKEKHYAEWFIGNNCTVILSQKNGINCTFPDSIQAGDMIELQVQMNALDSIKLYIDGVYLTKKISNNNAGIAIIIG